MRGDHDIENRGGGGGAKRNNSNYNSSNNNSGYASSSTYVIEDTETQWTSWLVPMFVVANVVVFIVVMYINNCPNQRRFSNQKCVARFLGRFSFQPLRQNPLFGPSSST